MGTNSELFLTTGKVISNYRVLIKYLEIVSDDLRNKALPRSSDLEYVKELLSRCNMYRLSDILDLLVRYLRDRVSPEYAVRAIRDVMNIELSPEDAVDYVAKQLAGWILEIAEQLNILRVRGSWERR